MELNQYASIYLFIYIQYLISLIFCIRILFYGFKFKTPKDVEISKNKIYFACVLSINILASMIILKKNIFYFISNNTNENGLNLFFISCVIFVLNVVVNFITFHLSKFFLKSILRKTNNLLNAFLWFSVNTISLIFLSDFYTALISNNTFFIN